MTTSYIVDKVAFVQHPVERKVWFRTHPAAAVVRCPQCRSPAGVPCHGGRGFTVTTHYRRRWRYEAEAKQRKRRATAMLVVAARERA